MKSMGERIAARLTELRQSQMWLAKKIGIQQPSVNKVIKDDAAGSKYVVPIARALDVSADWLFDGSGKKFRDLAPEALLVGKIGAGAEVIRLEEGVVMKGVEAPPGVDTCLAARVEGDSMYPFEDGWLIFYGEEHRGVAENCVGKLCAVGLKDGTTLVKKLRRGTRKGLWRLESWNAPAREDVQILWASKVIDIRPI